MKLLLIRHGETKENRLGLIIGQNPGHLSTTGKQSLVNLKKSIDLLHIDVVYSSDLKRCVDSAKLLFTGRNVDIKLESRLREINFGDLQGKPFSALKGDYLHDIGRKFPGGESNEEFIKRTIDAVNDIVKSKSAKDIVIICHSGTISIIQAAVKNKKFIDELENKANHAEIKQFQINNMLNYPL
jgi:alpha-ribazole phosphatase/probable phosphoglycerate mutase